MERLVEIPESDEQLDNSQTNGRPVSQSKAYNFGNKRRRTKAKIEYSQLN